MSGSGDYLVPDLAPVDYNIQNGRQRKQIGQFQIIKIHTWLHKAEGSKEKEMNYHWSTEEQLTVSHLQLAWSWAVHIMSSFEKFLLGSIHSWTWLEMDLCGLAGGLLALEGSHNA